jgi:hypothetical protein
LAGAVDVQRERDLCFAGLALDGCGSGHRNE